MINIDHMSVRLPVGKTPSSEILHDIHLDIERGEWVVIAGPNGSGKTTLLHAIAGVAPPSEGAVRYPGVDRDSPRIALVLQEPDNQFVASSVRNELILSVPADTPAAALQRACDAATDRFALRNLLDRNPHRLSGGEKQRLVLATAWLAQPEILLLDEPMAFLDATQQARCVEFVRELNQQSVTVVWTTPDGSGVENASRVIALEAGVVTYDGGAAGYQPQPATAVAAPAVTRAREAGATIVALRNIAFGYEDNEVLRDLTIEAQAAECLGITGHNGSGKTTLLGILAGSLQPRRGSVTRDYERIVEHERQQVFQLVQNPERLFFAETVLEELAFGMRKLGVDEPDRRTRAGAALLRVGLEPRAFLTRSPFSLSLGEMRRLAFAIAITLEPRLLLMDEPTSSLDAQGKTLFVELVTSLVASGMGVVVASHDDAILHRVCTRTVTLSSVFH